MTVTGMVVGTPAYMAPEQARGQIDLSPAADIFALGCVFFECLTGKPPFMGEYLESVLVRILFEEPPPLRSLRPDLPEAVEQLIARMLCKDPDQRIVDAPTLLPFLNERALVSGIIEVVPDRGAERLLGAHEQQLVSVLVGWLEPPAERAKTLAPAAQARLQSAIESLRKELHELGVRSELLADGTLVATVPSARETTATDQAQRAAHCALLLRERFPRAAMVLATGRAVLEGELPIGEVIGRAVKLAYSHPRPADELSAPPILVDTVTAGLLDVRFQTLPIDHEVVMLLGKLDKDESRPLLGKPTTCVGRDPELLLLDATLESCITEGSPRVIVIAAPPGFGKSRLRHEFIRRVRVAHSELPMLLGRGELMGTSTPFGMLRQALLGLCGVHSSDSVQSQQSKLRQRLGLRLLARDRDRTVAFLGELCGVPFSDAPDLMLNEARQQPRVLQDAICQAFLRWLRAECAAQPILLILEDLHSGDLASVQLLDTALRELEESPFFLLGLSRPEGIARFPRLWPEVAQSLLLRPLSRRAREQLVRQVLDHQVAPEAVVRIAERSAGNALYLEELIRAEVEGKGEELPPTVLAMLQARIGRLEGSARRVLRAASVFGGACWAGGVAAILSQEVSEATRWLEHLAQQELVEHKSESRFPGQTEFHFRHGLMRDAAYELLDDEDRALAHARAGSFLEHAGERAAVLAYHFHHGQDLPAALRYYEQAGDETAALSILDEARKHYAAALANIAGVPDGIERQRRHADLLIKQVAVGLMSEPAAVQLPRLAEVQKLLGPLVEPPAAEVSFHLFDPSHLAASSTPAEKVDTADILRLAHADYLHGRVLYYDNQPAEALKYHQRVRPVAERCSDTRLRTLNALAIGRAYVLTGRFGEASRLLHDVVEPMAELGDKSEWSRCFSFYAMALAGSGQYPQALAQLTRGLHIAEKTGQQSVVALYHLTKSGAHQQAADWPRMMEAAQRALQLAGEIPDKTIHYMVTDTLAWGKSQLGEPAAALALRQQARALRDAVGGGICRDWYEAWEAEILLNAGQPEAALRQAQSVVASFQHEDLPFARAVAHRAWARALAALNGNLFEVVAHFRAALAVCREHEQVVNEALTEVDWGQVLCQRGDQEAGALHLHSGILILESAGCEHAAERARQLIHRSFPDAAL